MLFHLALRRELSRSFGATLVVLVTVVMTMVLIRTLGLAAKGSVNPADVFMVMGYTLLGYLPILLSLCLFVATVSTLSRMYRDSEMAIWQSSGQGLSSFLRPIFVFASPVVMAIALLALFVWPWANLQTDTMRSRYEKRSDIDRVEAGRFQESANGQRVFFIDKDADDAHHTQNILIATREADGQTLTTARGGRLEILNNERFLILSDGQRLDMKNQNGQVRVSDFKELSRKMDGKAVISAQVRESAMYPWELVSPLSPVKKAELVWRVGLIFAALNFVLIALATVYFNPRSGRSGNLLFALFSFVLYYNLLNLGQSWVSGEKIRASYFIVLLHGGVFSIASLWLCKRHFGWSFWRLLGR